MNTPNRFWTARSSGSRRFMIRMLLWITLLLVLVITIPNTASALSSGAPSAGWQRKDAPVTTGAFQQAYLKASNAGWRDNFGDSVAIDGDTIAVVASCEQSNGSGPDNDDLYCAGAVYVFVRSGGKWVEQAYLKPPNPDDYDCFGYPLSLDGDTLLAGSPTESSDGSDPFDDSAPEAGAAYVFVRSGTVWSLQAYLKAPYPDAGDRFGESVAVEGDVAFIGAVREDGNGTSEKDNSLADSGAVYVFVRKGTTWTKQAYLKASNPDAGDLFGGSLSASGDAAIAGATGEDSNGASQDDNSFADAGAAYVFVRSDTNWIQQAYLKASNAEAGDTFGWGLAIDADTAVVSSPTEDGDGSNQSNNGAPDSGAAYVFVRDGATWNQQAYLKASNAEEGDLFGDEFSVAIDGDRVVVGAPREASAGQSEDDNSASRAGAAYVFARSGSKWSQQAYLKASNAEEDEYFGYSVAIDDSTVVVGAPWEDSNGSGENDNSAWWAGAAYVYGLFPQNVNTLYVSTATRGKVGDIPFAPADILAFDLAANRWQVYFDGSDVGIRENLNAFELDEDGTILLALGRAQTIKDFGTVTPQDVVRFIPSILGANTAGRFEWVLDGSSSQLTGSSERIDALGLTDRGSLALSTMGTARMSWANGGMLKAQNEDIFARNLVTGVWSMHTDGTAVLGLGPENINGLWIDASTGDLFVTIQGAFNLGDVAGNSKDIVKLKPDLSTPGGYRPTLFWDGSAFGFPTSIDAIDIKP